jgi:hypothetical protein
MSLFRLVVPGKFGVTFDSVSRLLVENPLKAIELPDLDHQPLSLLLSFSSSPPFESRWQLSICHLHHRRVY